MLSINTLSVARQMAEALTFAGYSATARGEHLPLGRLTPHYHVVPLGLDSDEKTPWDNFSRLTEHFQTTVGEGEGFSRDDMAHLTDNVSHGLQQMLTTAQKVIVPHCRKVVDQFGKDATRDQAPMSVTPLKIGEIHSDPGLVEHIQNRYGNARPRGAYPTVELETPPVDVLIDWMSQSGILDEEAIKRWALELDNELILTASYQLFYINGEVNFNEFNSHRQYLEQLDIRLVQYLLVVYLQDNPKPTRGTAVDLATWQDTFSSLRLMLGIILNRSYRMRAEWVRTQRVVAYYHRRARGGYEIKVTVNPDVYPYWIDEGHSVEALLGAAALGKSLYTASEINAQHDALKDAWEKEHYLIRQMNADRKVHRDREYLEETIQEVAKPTALPADTEDENDPDKLAPLETQLTSKEIRQRTRDVMRTVKDEELNDPWRVVTKVFCRVYYPNSLYEAFLTEMLNISTKTPSLKPREAASLAVIELLAQWLGDQLALTTFQSQKD